MEPIVVKIVRGKNTWVVNGSSEMTFGDLRKHAEAEAGAVEGGLRLIHKGKTPADTTTLAVAQVRSGTKMMALATAKQREADVRAEKNAKSAHDSAALDMMRERLSQQNSASASSATASAPTIHGDARNSERTCVLLKKGRDTYRANVSLSATVQELKAHASGLDGIDADARDIKVLHKGRFLKDETSLEDNGVRDGAVMMLMFGMRHHDRIDARVGMDEVEREIVELEQKVRGVAAKARGRLLDSTDLALAKGQVREMFERLKDNLLSVRGEDERRKKLDERLQQVEVDLEKL